jgi:hypothetical protein
MNLSSSNVSKIPVGDAAVRALRRRFDASSHAAKDRSYLRQRLLLTDNEKRSVNKLRVELRTFC